MSIASGSFRASWVVLSLAFVALTLAGCARTAEPSKSPSTNPFPTPTTATPTPDAVTAKFRGIAQASCDRANAVGVVEVTTGPRDFRQVLAPPSMAYKDYRGAYFMAPDTYELVLDTGGFAACAAASAFALFDEQLGTEITIVFDSTTGTYSTLQDLEELGIQQFDYKVADGIIVAALRSAEDGKYDTVLTYGQLTDTDLEIIRKAVDRL